MGLAASQARLLMLTSRQSDVEGRLMKIANEKLSLSRQSSELSEEYSNSLSARKLTWDTTDGGTTALTYNLLMSQASTNTAGQYMITDSNGRVILNDNYANIIGGTASNGSPSAVDKTKMVAFLEAMGIMDAETYVDKPADNKTDNTTDTKPKVATGTPLSTMESTEKSLMSYAISNASSANYIGSIEPFKALLTQFSTQIDSEIQKLTGLSDSQMTYLNTTDKFTKLEYEKGKSLTSFESTIGGDKYKELEYLVRMKRGVVGALQLVDLYKNNTTTTAKNTITAAVSLLLQGGTSKGTGVPCFYEPENMLVTGNDEGWWDDGYKDKYGYNLDGGNDGSGHTDVDHFSDGDDGQGGQHGLGTYLDYNFNGAWSGTSMGATGYKGGGGNSVFTEDISDLFKNYDFLRSKNDGGSTTTGSTSTGTPPPLTEQAQADYYINLYDAICTQGWVRNSNMNSGKDPDGKYLQNLLLNGGAYIYQLQSDKSWKLTSTSDAGSPMNNVSDDGGVKQAEADYNSDKDKLDYKETQLDLQMNNLDTERSAISTEMESVQKIIDSNIKKFKMFDA